MKNKLFRRSSGVSTCPISGEMNFYRSAYNILVQNEARRILETPLTCKCCTSGTNDFVSLNADTVPYGEVEIAINRQGMLRARHYPADGDGGFDSQDIVNINFCPICGRKIRRRC